MNERYSVEERLVRDDIGDARPTVVDALSPRYISPTLAQQLVDDAQSIRTTLGC